jgi:hypothetical protein
VTRARRPAAVRRRVGLLVPLVALAAAAGARAHATVTPSLVAPGAVERFLVRVPNERRVAITGVEVTLPPGFALASPEAPSAPWTASSSGPTVSFAGGRIAPDALESFPLHMRVPEKEGASDLTVRELYTDGAGPAYTVTVVVAGSEPMPTTRDPGARTLARAGLAVAVAAAAVALLAFFLALWLWLRAPPASGA